MQFIANKNYRPNSERLIDRALLLLLLVLTHVHPPRPQPNHSHPNRIRRQE
jgi:hypothetical protein